MTFSSEGMFRIHPRNRGSSKRLGEIVTGEVKMQQEVRTLNFFACCLIPVHTQRAPELALFTPLSGVCANEAGIGSQQKSELVDEESGVPWGLCREPRCAKASSAELREAAPH